MPKKFKILALDLHNTIYDEVMEFGLAIDAAISSFLVPREVIYAELSAAHAKAGSDWDDDVWETLPSLKNTSADEIKKAIAKRRTKSRELVISGVYPGAVETLKELKNKAVRIYLITEATAEIAMLAVDWLGLGGVINGVYTYPSSKNILAIEQTYHKSFPALPNGSHLKKPHPEVLLQVARDDAKASGKTLQETLESLLYVGDSKFKDGIMARDAGVAFAWAAYGKKVKAGEEALFSKSREIMYAVTGWDKDTLKLTQEAGKSAAVNNLQPDFILENTLAEIKNLF